MLKEIFIENLAVIKQAVIPFSDGLNIFTGETGAGKSILINGINAVLGQRSTKDIVRSGCNKAVVTALFTDIAANVKEKLDEFGVSYEDDEISITREINADGGSVARINGRTTSVSVLKELGSLLINIHGQHDNQILMDSEKHIKILDSFGGDDTLLTEYKESFKQLQQTARKLKELKKRETEKAERLRSLNEIIEEMRELELEEGEDEALEKEYETAQNAEQIISSLNMCVQLLSGEESASDLILKAESELEDLSDSSPYSELYERLSAAEIEISDIADELTAITDKIELDGQRVEYLRQRISKINHLKRKYMCDCSQLIDMYNNALEETGSLESSSDEIKKLNEEKEDLLKVVTERAKTLSKFREETARKFVSRVTEELTFLNMPNVILDVKHEKGKLTVNGMDTMEFLISANKGEEPKPISRIASGGELSRIMLALKSVIADKDSIPTMIFDEIDTGVSGKAAQKIGIKLKSIGKVRQVICVTHLSQIAVMADNHLMIEKKTDNERTETSVYQLDFKGRTAEIARIMGGENPSQLMLKTAEEELIKAKEMCDI
ncbi:MAG: DNA repair protein RecN [Ruminococcus sp.]|nr:DNA repair protein RecN [Ruminococcus sp.]MDY3214806.1 DNA repair protein RecN [Ruminococcus sp.]